MHVVLAYDVARDDRRLRIARTLEAVGRRVQYSLFEANLERRELDAIVREVERQIDSRSDSFVVYRLCGRCTGEIIRLGGRDADDSLCWFA